MTKAPGGRLALVFIFITSLLDSIGFGLILPVLPDLLMEISGEDVAAAARYGGALMFTFAVVQFGCAPVLGNLSDRFGRRPVLLVSLAVSGINYLVMALAGSIALLFIGRVISGIGSATHSTCSAYIADSVPIEKRAQSFGLLGAAFGMGFIIGPVLGGLLGEYGPRAPFYAAAVLTLTNMAFGFLVLKESLRPEDRRPFDIARANPLGALKALRRYPIVFGIVGVIVTLNIGHFVMPATWSYFTIEKFSWSASEIGYSLGAVGVLMVLVQGFLIRWILPRTGLRMAGVLGMMFLTLSYFGYGAASEAWMIYAVMIPGALGAIQGPAISAIVTAQVSAAEQGELQGAIACAGSLCAIIGPPIMTETFAWFTSPAAPAHVPGAAFFLAGFLSFIALLMFIRVTAVLDIPDPAAA